MVFFFFFFFKWWLFINFYCHIVIVLIPPEQLWGSVGAGVCVCRLVPASHGALHGRCSVCDHSTPGVQPWSSCPWTKTWPHPWSELWQQHLGKYRKEPDGKWTVWWLMDSWRVMHFASRAHTAKPRRNRRTTLPKKPFPRLRLLWERTFWGTSPRCKHWYHVNPLVVVLASGVRDRELGFPCHPSHPALLTAHSKTRKEKGK